MKLFVYKLKEVFIKLELDGLIMFLMITNNKSLINYLAIDKKSLKAP